RWRNGTVDRRHHNHIYGSLSVHFPGERPKCELGIGESERVGLQTFQRDVLLGNDGQSGSVTSGIDTADSSHGDAFEGDFVGWEAGDASPFESSKNDRSARANAVHGVDHGLGRNGTDIDDDVCAALREFENPLYKVVRLYVDP